MKITVITVCLNAEKTIADCIQSVAGQSYMDVEHWIVDGGSTDNTLEIIEANQSQGMRVISENDDGIYAALNRGIKLASGEVIGFLNADDVFENADVLKSVAKTLAAPEVDGCYADLLYVRENDLSHVVRFWKSEPFEKGAFLKGWMPPHPTFYARATVYREIGGFRTDMRIGADWEFLLRFFEKEKRTARYVPETWVRMRLGGVSNRNIKNVLRNNFDTWRVCCAEFGFLPSLLFPIRKWIHRLKQFVR